MQHRAVGRMKADTLGSCWKLWSQIAIAVFFLEPEHWKFKNRKCMEKQVCTDGFVLGLTVYLDSGIWVLWSIKALIYSCIECSSPAA